MIKTIEELDETRSYALCELYGLLPHHAKGYVSTVATIREHDATHGLPADLVVALMCLHAADPASVTAVASVVAERLRQIEGEGLTTAHDDLGLSWGLPLAAACYAAMGAGIDIVTPEDESESLWPWDREWWKPSTPARNRCKAMALLIAAEARAIRAESGAEKSLKIGVDSLTKKS